MSCKPACLPESIRYRLGAEATPYSCYCKDCGTLFTEATRPSSPARPAGKAFWTSETDGHGDGFMHSQERAYPSVAIDDRYGGMALRDAFAIAALSGVLAKSGWHPSAKEGQPLAEHIADITYHIADAMMARRAPTDDK